MVDNTGVNLLAGIGQNPGDNSNRQVYCDWMTDNDVDERIVALWRKETAYDAAKPCDKATAREAYQNAFNALKDMPQFSAALHQASISDEGKLEINAADFFANATLLTETLGVRRVRLLECMNHLDICPECFGTTEALRYLTGLEIASGTIDAIGPKNAEKLAASPYLINLTALDLGGNYIGDAGALALARSPNMVKLTRLNLRSNDITTAGAQALAGEESHLKHLTELNLGYNKIGDAGALALAAGLKNVRILTLHEGSVNQEAYQELQNNNIIVRILPSPRFGYTPDPLVVRRRDSNRGEPTAQPNR